MNIVIGSIMHESNTFTPVVTNMEMFKRTQYLSGADILRYHRDRPSEIGGMLAELTRLGVDVLPTISALAMPYGMITTETYSLLKTELLDGINQQISKLDGVLLALHGSMSVEGIEDAEGDLLTAIRQLLPDGTPLGATLDHHANVSEAMVDAATFLVGYRTHPHVDQFDVGRDAASLIVALIAERPLLTRSFIKLPLITPAENRSEPIRALAAEIDRISRDPAVFTSSYFVGYPWADVSIIGASVLAITRGDQALADAYARQLAETMWSLRGEFAFTLHSMEAAIREGSRLEKPVVLDELSDCTLGGASGDVVTSVRYLLENRVKNSIAVGIVDPESATRAFESGAGAAINLTIGGKICTDGNPPLEFSGTVITTGENVSGKGSIHSGYETQIGKVAVVERDGVQIVLIERPGKLDGPSFLEALGIDPKTKDFIVVKEGLNPLVMYKGVASRIIMVDSPGFDRQYLPALNYRNVPRPIYPLDPDMSWSARPI
jgi:microcystin degradation protein MlrC